MSWVKNNSFLILFLQKKGCFCYGKAKYMDKKGSYVDIYDWMLDKNLSPNELITFALIYSFSKDNDGCYYGSLSTIAKWLNIRRDKVCIVLNSLVKMNLISKERVITFKGLRCKYKTNITPEPKGEEAKIRIYEYMTSLNLKARELLLFALVDTFSKLKYFCYFKRYADIAKWLNVDTKHVNRYINSLINKNLISVTQDGNLTTLSIEAYNTAINASGIVYDDTVETNDFSLAQSKKGTPTTNLGTSTTNTGTNNNTYNDIYNKENKHNTSNNLNICDASFVVDSIISKSSIEIENLETLGVTDKQNNEARQFLQDIINDYSQTNKKALLNISELNARYLYNLSVSLINQKFTDYFSTLKSTIAFMKSNINKMIVNYDCAIYKNQYKLAYETVVTQSPCKAKSFTNDLGMPEYSSKKHEKVDLVELYEKIGNFEAAEEERQKRLIAMNY